VPVEFVLDMLGAPVRASTEDIGVCSSSWP
jgi:hypothetical protein